VTKSIKERMERVRADLEVVERAAEAEQRFHHLEFILGLVVGFLVVVMIFVVGHH
jgi:hypothetical protein